MEWVSILIRVGSNWFYRTNHTNMIYFYRKPNTSWPAIIHTLESSLSKVLVPFYPVAGRLRSVGGGRFELDCNGKGAVFVAAELNAELVDFGDFTPSTKFDQFLIPPIDYSVPIDEVPVLVAQVTKFECGGVSLSIAMSHVVADGKSAANFVAEWARLARGEFLQIAPVLDRKAFRAGEPPSAMPRFDHSKDFGNLPFLLKLPSAEEVSKMKTTMVRLGLDKGQVEKLKKMANNQSRAEGARPYTRYESVAAHIWKCSTRQGSTKSSSQRHFSSLSIHEAVFDSHRQRGTLATRFST